MQIIDYRLYLDFSEIIRMHTLGERHLKAFHAALPVAIAMLDNDMRYLYYSDEWLKQYYLGEQSLYGRSHYDVFPEISEHWKAMHRRSLGGETMECEADPFEREDGTIQYISWKMHPWYEDDGCIGGIILQTEDVTEFVVDKLKTDFRETILRQMERVASIGYWEVDLLTGGVNWSPQSCVIYDLPPGSQPTQDEVLSYYKEGESRQKAKRALKAALNEGIPWNLELEIVTVQQNTRWICAIGEAIFQDSTCVRLFGTFQDITAEVARRNEMLEQRQYAELMLNERSHLLAKISHELRTPLNGVVGMLQSMAVDNDGESKDRKIAIALRSAKVLMRIINDVLDYTKIDQNEMQFEYSNFSISDFISDLIDIFQPLAQKKNIAFSHKLIIQNNQLDEWVYFDPIRLGQIISNLLSNAIKFTSKGSVNLSVSVAIGPIKTTVKIVVKDSGIGMNAHDVKALFTPFKQVGKHTNALYGGTGLGLSIVKQLVDKMGGTITVKSEEQVGTRFIVELDMLKGLADIPKVWVDNTLPPDAKHLRILIVDDVDINIEVLNALLSQFNVVETDRAENGQQCIECCIKGNYDVIFMDLNMPVLDGFDTARQLRERKLVSDSTKIFALTAMTTEETKDVVDAAGMDGVITKPVESESLAKIIQSCI